ISSASRWAVTPAIAASAAGAPAGSTIRKCEAAPLASQPRSIADPIWPQPTRTIVPALPATGAAPWLIGRALLQALRDQASPIGSIIAVAIASSGDLPPQITN